MSIPIVEENDSQDLSIKFPKKLWNVLRPSIKYSGPKEIALVSANDYLLVVKICKGVGKTNHNASGQYTFSKDWGTFSITKSEMLTQQQQELFDLIVINTKIWGPTAETCLEFLEHTLE